MARTTAPKTGVTTKKPQTKRTQKIARGAPTSGSGSDTSPFSSAHKGGKK